MWGRKQRRIDELTAQGAGLKKELRELWQSMAEKNKKIIALNDSLNVAAAKNARNEQMLHEQSELIRGLNAQITQLTRALEREQADARKAEQAADTAINAGGILGDQLHAAEAVIVVKEATIAGLDAEIVVLKADKAKLSEALGQARADLDRYRAAEIAGQRKSPIVGPAPKRPASAKDAARPQLEIAPEPDSVAGKSS